MVAERAGVSRGTVDRVLNNRSYVKPEVRQRILDAISELGYISPREMHRDTIDGEKGILTRLGVLMPNWTGNFRTGILGGIEKAKRELEQYNVHNSKRISFVGQDYIKSGQVAAEIVSKCVSRDDLVLAMCGNREFDGDSKRLDGFLKRMQEQEFLDIVTAQFQFTAGL